MSAQSDKQGVARRRFLATAVKATAGAGCAALLVGEVAAPSRTLAATALRPPGAKGESHFLAACVRCGLCVRACPYDTLKLADLADPASSGTPYFEARQIPCEMCEDIPCVVACPTGALDKGLTDIAQARMGTAALVGHETCLNVLGLRCDVCYRVCPLMGKAITLDMRHNERTGKHASLIPVVHTDACTGCGKCEKSCVLEEAAIKVLPTELARGRIGGHYRLGWEEKAKHGGELVDGIIDLPDRGYTPPSLGPSLGKEFKP
ncbi:ferredoxin-type protein NapG [Azospirillum soli]|uniref:ferredoxin-type protein NapG n=1 Tax=Azospirillum soli TaxID=1304799 RepID=UPI001AE7B367|nr:ferredoxin-type protein NapG [Azospirillum soli]MBP2312256.1 ferredoxin-type protein NapG [Azospirillum soli]